MFRASSLMGKRFGFGMWTFTIAGSTGIMWSGDFDETNYYNDYFVYSYVFIFFCILLTMLMNFFFFSCEVVADKTFLTLIKEAHMQVVGGWIIWLYDNFDNFQQFFLINHVFFSLFCKQLKLVGEGCTVCICRLITSETF